MSLPALVDRSHYAALDDAVYLNQASLGLIGRPATDAMHAFLDEVGRHGNLHMSDAEETAYADALRERGARLLHADRHEVAILGGASELLGQLPMLLQPPTGSNVVAVATDFPAVTRPWLGHADANVRFVADDPSADLTDSLIAALDERTSVVAVGQVQYATGTVTDVPRLREATRHVGAHLVVDASQAAGAIRVDAQAWGADIVVTSGYKWLGGHGGVALAVISPELLKRDPPLPGWMGAPDPFAFDATRLAFAAGARRYTQSTMSYLSIAGLTAALDALLAFAEEQREDRARELANALIDGVSAIGWIPFREISDKAASAHIVALSHDRVDAEMAADELRRRHIVCGTRNGTLRVSIAPYNDDRDIAALVEVLRGFRG